VPGPTATGKEGCWKIGELRTVARAWYEIAVAVPAAWQGRAILLDQTRVSTDAVVYANGVECGKIEWPDGFVDVTRAVKPGETATLRLLVAAVPEAKDVTVYMGVGNNQTWTQPAQLGSRGLVGEAFLRSRPAGPHVSDVFVRPSVRRKTLALDVEVSGLKQAGPVAFTARLLDEAGKVEQTFQTEKPLAAAGTQGVVLEWPWPTPRLWDLGRPNLYTLELAAKGSGLDDEYPQVFGFREFWLDGVRFLLNGTEIRLRPVCLWDQWNNAAWVPAAIESILTGYATSGFNLAEHWPDDEDLRGTVYLRGLWAEAADRQGFLLAGSALSMNSSIFGPGWRFEWDRPGVKQRWEERMARSLRRLRNHPSIVMWGTSANLFGRMQDQSPQVIGRRNWYEHDPKAKAGLEGVALIKKHDPTRPVFAHHGADIGDLHTVNCYLDLTPLQEREEWLSAYARQADMPLMPIEFGTPLHTTFMRGRNGFPEAIVSEPLMTEFCAIYLGDKAYALETDAYRQRIEKTYQGPQRWSNWHGAPELEQAPAFQALEALFIRNTWRSWRTWGITAGMVPWSMGHGWAMRPDKRWDEETLAARPGQRGAAFPRVPTNALHYLRPEGNWVTYPAGQALIDNNSATLAWIAGPPERFTAKDHLFQSGEMIGKQVVLINDERTAQPYRAAWALEVGGKPMPMEERSGEIAPARNVLLPVSLKAPAVAARTAGRLVLDATIGQHRHHDEFALTVFPTTRAATGDSPAYVFDPEGMTTKLLRSLGQAATPWDGAARPGSLVIIGRHALDGQVAPPGPIEKHVASGGRLLILGQSPEWFRSAMGLRVGRQVSRRFFPVTSQTIHPLLAGFDAEDFRDWRGSGTLVPETWGGLDESPAADPVYGWHWGNQGSVSSAAIEKPHFSGWRPILEGEFDLAYSPLMELHYGAGVALLCTLDLEGRTQGDPVADSLARRLIAYTMQIRPEPRAAATVYLGGDADRRVLRRMGLQFTSATKLPTGRALAVIGGDATVTPEAVSVFLRGGGRMLMLPRKSGADPWKAIGQPVSFCGTSDIPDWPECRGLSLSDLRLRGMVEFAPVTATGAVVAGAGGLLGRQVDGGGVAILLQLTADKLPGRDKTYLRYSQWRLTRTLTQLLANLGGAFEMDTRSLTPNWNRGYLPMPLAGDWQFKVERLLPPATDPSVRTKDPGRALETEGWESPDLATADWQKMALPGVWEKLPGVGEKDGSFWVRREVQIPEAWTGQELVLQLGAVDDKDTTWFNGTKVGETSGWNVPRTYRIPGDLVRAGRNVIAIRVFDEFGSGGFGGRAEELRLGRVVPASVVEGEEILRNRDFADGLTGWTLGAFAPAEATAKVTDDVPAELLGQRSVKIEVTKRSETSWHVQFTQPGFGIQAGVTYIWTVWARASKPSMIVAAIEKNHPPYGGAGLFDRVSISTEWKQIRITFTPRESDDNVRFGFQELAADAVTYWFAAPSFAVAPDRSVPREAVEMRSFYSLDYIEGQELGDDPYRYYRW
jgi:beta-galactosidase